MAKQIPNISFEKNIGIGVEVMNFGDLIRKLKSSKNHNPFDYHSIRFYFILLIVNGEIEHHVDFKDYNLVAGDAIFISDGQVHKFSEKIANAEGIGIVFDNSYFDKSKFFSGRHKFQKLFNYHTEHPIILREEMFNDNIFDIANCLYDEQVHHDEAIKYEIVYSLLKILLLKAERIKQLRSEDAVSNKWLEIFTEFKFLLENEYQKTRSSRYYASKLLISYKLLNDIVKKLVQKTAKTFIDDFVVIEIKRLLVSTSLSIKEIAYKTGFEEPANLVKFFKKNTSTTPLQFRKQFKT